MKKIKIRYEYAVMQGYLSKQTNSPTNTLKRI